MIEKKKLWYDDECGSVATLVGKNPTAELVQMQNRDAGTGNRGNGGTTGLN